MAELKALKKRRAYIKGQITRLINYVDHELNDNTTPEDIKARLTNVDRLRTQMMDVEDQIMKMDDEEELDINLEDNYYKVVVGLNIGLRNKVSGNIKLSDTMNDTHGANSRAEVRLPKIAIPNYYGDYTEWQSFYDLFCSAIHDNGNLTPSQKLQYLKGALKGEAAGLLKHFSITDANYIEALNKLKERYDRKRHTIYAFIKTFMSQPSVSTANSQNIRKLLDTSDEVIRGLKALGEKAESRDHWLIYLLTCKLDDKTNSLWAQTSSESEFPTLQQFFEFLGKRIDALESLRTTVKRTNPQPCTHKFSPVKSHVSSSPNPCPLCPEDCHRLFECSKLKQMPVDQRKDFMKKSNRCFNCFNDNHNVYQCQSKFRCRLCSRKHHSLLHEDTPDSKCQTSSVLPVSKLDDANVMTASTNCYNASGKGAAVLPTAIVNVLDGQNTKQQCRVLLDSGSQRSFITESCMQRLMLKRRNAKLSVSGIGDSKSGYTKGIVSLIVTPRINDTPCLQIEALILPKLTSKQPPTTFAPLDMSFCNKYELADPNFYQTAEIDILIGSDYFFGLLENGKILGDQSRPTMQKTVFGWVIAGKFDHNRSIHSFTTTTSSEEDNLNKLIQRFWEIEGITTTTKTAYSEEEQFCESHFKETKQEDETGRIIVRLPFKNSPTTLGDSLGVAIQRMRSMERKFSKNEEFALLYKEFMSDYQKLGHMKEVTLAEQGFHGYYLPHHGIIKPSSATTKLRVVFDGSAKTTNGISLNDCLAVGPTLQPNLYDILSRFREFKIVFTSDVEKMFRQVLVAKEDRKYQRIIWRDNPNLPFKHFELQTVTYGTSSAPFHATRALMEAALRHQDQYPEAVEHIMRDIYVDDLMSGADTISEAILLKNTITSILKGAGFHLRKWVSNVDQVLIDTAEDRSDQNIIEIEDSSLVKVLGLLWDPQEDCFHFRVRLLPQPILTKRGILSEASRLFDPLGLLSPVIVQIKVFFQNLWIENLDWDDQLPAKLSEEWMKLRNNLLHVENIKIQRYIKTTSSDCLELHGFSDASKEAYSAVVYGRIRKSTGENITVLLSSKTKVSPVKQLSIPRLELCGALLLKNLLMTVKETMRTKIDKMYAWTDSTIVLDWLSAHPKHWNTFIGNRTSEILTNMSREQWNHVRSEENPADCASRGMDPERLRHFNLWWNGPEWLNNSEDWPQRYKNSNATTEERKTQPKEKKIQSLQAEIHNPDVLDNISQKFSSFAKMIRVLAYVLRFIQYKTKIKTTYLQTEELLGAEKRLLKNIQEKNFAPEIQQLSTNKKLQNSSKLKFLQPFIDKFGLLRVGGRLSNASINYEVKHPIILPAKDHLTEVIIKENHIRHLHSGQTLMMATLRQKYWILGCRNLVKRCVHDCIQCTKFKAKPMNQIMGDLPEPRVDLIRPFLKVGVDYAGPFLTHLTRGRGQKTYKSYVCLFVCLSTKAVHLELVADLTTDAYIAALRRFVARRGLCKEIHSDNGSNFVGAKNQIKQLYQLIMKNTNYISDFFNRDRISFHFIPPRSPHFGGLWEAAIKSTKFHLKRSIGDHILTLEEMTTLLAEIEAILNSRPLCVLSSEDLDALTPAHFLIGRPTTQIPTEDFREIKISRLSRWQMIHKINQQFWKRWSLEYLTTLQQRNKWNQDQPNINIDSIVVIKEDNLPPSKWLLGRVVQLHPGPDKKVRVVTLKTVMGITKRPIQKLCLLPTS